LLTADCRAKKVKIGVRLEASNLITWHYYPTPKSECVELVGMQWSYVEIFDIFSILASICEASYIGGEENEGRWFDHDKEALKATRVKIAKAEGNMYNLNSIYLTLVPQLASFPPPCFLNYLR
jgi:hypothetical protein